MACSSQNPTKDVHQISNKFQTPYHGLGHFLDLALYHTILTCYDFILTLPICLLWPVCFSWSTTSLFPHKGPCKCCLLSLEFSFAKFSLDTLSHFTKASARMRPP